MNEIAYCPNCSSERIESLKGYEKNGRLARCKSCDMIFATLVADDDELHDIYDSYGRNDYLSEVTVKRYNELLDIFEKYRKTGRILDVGCGIGYFLESAKRRGWMVYGTEFSDKAISICEEKGIIMHKGGFDTAPFENEEFDVITSFEVIEHISKPADLMSFVKFLRKNGAFYLTTPNFNSIIRRMQKSECDILSNNNHLEHISFFTKKSIKKLLKRYSLSYVYIKTHGISISRIKNYKSRKKNDKIITPKEKYISESSTDEKLRIRIEASPFKLFLKKMANEILSVCGVGDSLKVLAEKK